MAVRNRDRRGSAVGRPWGRILRWFGVASLLLLVVAELGVRMAGMVDFPLYDANGRIGYVPKPGQHGSFLNSHDWEFNSLSMGAEAFLPRRDARNILLVGDSIVLGGNPFRQQDRLGPQLQSNWPGSHIWPISAGSWALQNELTWLEDHSAVLDQVDQVAFVLNNGDFEEPSEWKCETTHPTHPPLFALGYLFSKYVLDLSGCSHSASPFPVPFSDWRPRLAAFLGKARAKGKVVTFHLYPDKEENANRSVYHEWTQRRAKELSLAGASHIQVLFDSRQLDSGFYRDGIHPTPAATALLASEIAGFAMNAKLGVTQIPAVP